MSRKTFFSFSLRNVSIAKQLTRLTVVDAMRARSRVWVDECKMIFHAPINRSRPVSFPLALNVDLT